MRMTSRGQVTIPAEIRRQAGLLPITDVDVSFDGGIVRLQRAAKPPARRGRALVAHLRNRGDVPLTTDEIMAATRDA